MRDCCHSAGRSRRGFLKSVTLGGGALLLAAAAGEARAGQTEAVLLTCMDYRLTDKVDSWMAGKGLKGQYDHLVLAGASLGAMTDNYPDWGKTFREHLSIAKQLHHIKRVIVLDHRDCGAYKVILGEAAVKDAATETASHATCLHRLRDAIKAEHPELTVELGIMALDGTVESVA